MWSTENALVKNALIGWQPDKGLPPTSWSETLFLLPNVSPLMSFLMSGELSSLL